MKKIVLLVCMFGAMCLPGLKAQVLFFDNFSNPQLPNWTIDAQGASNVSWKRDATGQTANQYPFNYAGATNGALLVDSDGEGDTTNQENTTITSRAINCSGKTLVLLSFYEWFAKFAYETPLVLVSKDSINWTAVYTPDSNLAQFAATPNPHYVQLDVSSIAANDPSVYIRFSWTGWYDLFWFVDDVTLFTPQTNNIAATQAVNTFSNGCVLGTAEPVGLVVKNLGQTPVTTFVAHFKLNNAPVVTETVVLGAPLLRDSSYTYTFNSTLNLSAAGGYSITVWAELAGDTIHSNDTATSAAISVTSVDPATPYAIGFEVPSFGTELATFAWATIDENDDNNTWYLSTAVPRAPSRVNFRYIYNPNGVTGGDDWLISTCIDMDATKAYTISFWDKTAQNYPEKLELKAGTSQTVAGMTEVVKDFGTLDDSAAYVKREVGFKPSGTGTYYIGFHCYSDADQFYLNIDDFSISLLPKPVAAFGTSLKGDTLIVSDSSGSAITSWRWTWGDGGGTTNASPAPHVYAQPGTYQVCLIVTNLAGADTLCKTVTIAGPTGIAETDISDNIGVFPNPTNGAINIFLNDAVKNNCRIEIINAVGETTISRNTTGTTVENISLDNIAGGVYFVKITGTGVRATKKFVYLK